MKCLEVQNLSARFGSFKLKDINLTLKRKEILVILGKNGAGKTKFLECICGIEPTNSGKVLLNGIDITFKKPQQRSIGFISAHLGLFPHMNVYDNISYGLKFRSAQLNIASIIDLFNLKDFLKRKPNQLSSGQRQKVALARAFCANPNIILLDEPTSDISYIEKPKLLKEMKMLLNKFNYSALFVTHDMQEAIYMADRVALMENGTITLVQDLEDFLFHPLNFSSAAFLNYNIFNGDIISNEQSSVIKIQDKAILSFAPASLGKITFAIRPDMIFLSKSKTDLDNSIKCKVVEISFNGFIYIVSLDCGFFLHSSVVKYNYDELNLKLNDNVYANFSKMAVVLI